MWFQNKTSCFHILIGIVILVHTLAGFSYAQDSGSSESGIVVIAEKIMQDANTGVTLPVQTNNSEKNNEQNNNLDSGNNNIQTVKLDTHFSAQSSGSTNNTNGTGSINTGKIDKPLFFIEFIYSEKTLTVLQTPNKISKVLKKIDHSLNTYVKEIEGEYYLIGIGEIEGRVNSAAVKIISENKSDTSESTGNLITPKRNPIKNYNNFLLPESVKSFDYQTTDGMTYCSYVARLNLEKITGLSSNIGSISLDPNIISMGDAVTLIEQGKQANLFKQFYFSQTDNLPNEISKIGGTIFDMYAYHKDMQTDNIVKKFHRFVGFFGDDGILYIIDPIVLHHTQPVKRHEYIKNLKEYQSIIYVYEHGFIPSSGTIVREDGVFLTDTKSLRDKKNQDLLTSINDIFDQIGGYVFEKEIFYMTKNSIINIPKKTEIGFLPGAIRSIYQFKITEDTSNETYSIRIGDENLVFSKPIEITIETENNMLDSDFQISPSTSSSSTISDGLCLPDGTNTQSIFSNGKIQGGLAKIYVCRGGKYTISY